MPSDWERHPSGITFRKAHGDRPGEILYQVASSRGRWLSRSEFEAAIPRTTYPTPPGPRPQDFRLFPPDTSAQTTEANAGHGTSSINDEANLYYEHGPRNAGEQGRHDPARATRIDEQGRPIHPASRATRRPSTVTSDGQHDSYQPQLTPLGQDFAQLEIGDFDGLGQFVLKNARIIAQLEIDGLLSEAPYAQRAGKEALAQRYIHHAVLLQKCSKCRPEDLKPLFQRLATRGQTAKDLFADVNKAYNAIKGQYAAPEPRRQDQVAQDIATAVPERSHAGNPEPQIIQTREQRDKGGQRVYVDSHGREVCPAGGRHESQQSRRDSQTALPTAKMSQMTFDDSGDYDGHETSAQTKERGRASADPRPEQAIDSPIGSPAVKNQRRQRYSIEGTAGDREALDADYMKRWDPKDFFTLGKVFALLWHQSMTGERPKFELSREISVTKGPFKQEIHSSIRRMVVVKEGRGHCWCLMIYTYGEQGVLKSGLSANDRKAHAVIYMTGARPTNLQDEHLMNKEPIAVDPVSADRKLNRWSRLDFRRVHTVEHNVKVKNIGRVSRGSMPYLMTYFKDVVNEA